MYLSCFDEVKDITEQMVRVPSIVKTSGESDCARTILAYYQSLPYFQQHPDHLTLQRTEDDEIERYNVIAMVRGAAKENARTVLLMGHFDTVGIDDYGPLKPHACDPSALPTLLRELPLSDEVKRDIDSGEYMFGRGALDMKSGVAGHMYLIKYFSEHPEALNGTLIAMAQCDEEDGSHGALSCLSHLKKLKGQYGLEYQAAVNADFSTPADLEDDSRYIYFGTIGKVLPSFYVVGKEAHVGQAFAALDPNLLVAEITRLISLNADLSDESQGEVTVPPVSLKQADFKDHYTVQTALTAYAYYNFFVHKMAPEDVMEKVEALAHTAFENVIADLNRNFEKYSGLCGTPYTPLPWKPRVYTWEAFRKEMEALHGDTFTKHMADFGHKLHTAQPNLDLRLYSVQMVEEAWKWAEDKSPAIIIYFSSTFCARMELTGEAPREAALLNATRQAVEKVQPTIQNPVVTKMFYPYISDISFLGMSDSRESLARLASNMPAWGEKYTYPIDDIMEIDVPAVNIGSFGKDGHMLTERVHMRYTFETVPNITYNTILKLLE
ncbi:M20/M25/M40 family metallo-hydrolase [Ruminococcaceae bacterium OttesenSCG-928-A11]|nr:M20/M25/M40 family metallo-hydrolase [Ruminococcaceae bacterium OttesenSCG-928-A11]